MLIDEQEILNLIEKDTSNSKNDEPSKLPYSILKFRLYDFFINERKVNFTILVQKHYPMHIERVSKFL